MYIGIEVEKHILSYVYFLRLCNVINQFPEFVFWFLKMVLLLLFHLVREPFNGEKKVLTGLEKYLKKLIHVDMVTIELMTIVIVKKVNLKEQVI